MFLLIRVVVCEHDDALHEIGVNSEKEDLSLDDFHRHVQKFANKTCTLDLIPTS